MTTQKIKTSKATPGMIVADDIYSFADQLIISAGTELTDRIITRLKFYTINELRILLPDKEPVKKTPVVKKKDPYISRVRSSEEFKDFSRSFAASVVVYKTQMNSILTGTDEVDVDALVSNVQTVIKKCKNPSNIFDMLQCLRQFDDVTYIHGINVAMISYVLGSWLKFSTRDLRTLMEAGLLHDIGKMQIPKDILSKPTKLSSDEYATMKTHALCGYNILRSKKLDEHVKLAAFMHHERCDGSGYPLGLTGDQIDEFAKIVAIADVYDAMTSSRVYRESICPLSVISIFESEGLLRYEPRYLLAFMEGVVQTYLNATVELNTGEIGEIVLINKTRLSKPVVKVGDKFIDTSQMLDINIVRLL